MKVDERYEDLVVLREDRGPTVAIPSASDTVVVLGGEPYHVLNAPDSARKECELGCILHCHTPVCEGNLTVTLSSTPSQLKIFQSW